jgi:hypothetical protein
VTSENLEVAIVGAGPYGLSAAVHLQRAGIRAQVFGPPMAFWKTMPTGMKLRSAWSASSIAETTGPLSIGAYREELGDAFGPPVPLRRFVAYGEWFQRRAVPGLDPRMVARLGHGPGASFALTLEDGERVTARRVVVACGIAPFAHVPDRFARLPRALVSHTGEHHDPTEFAGRRVAVLGSGQSAFESAVLMHERGADVEVIARRESVVWLRSFSPKLLLGPLGDLVYAPTDVGPLWYSRLIATPDLFRRLPAERQAAIAYRAIRPACSYFVKVRLDDVRLTLGTEVEQALPAARGLRLELSDGTTRHVDHLLLGTGYRVDVDRYGFWDADLLARVARRQGHPVLKRGLETSVPRLHVLGAPAALSFGPTMRFVSGSWYAGRAVARAAASRRRAGRGRVAVP